MSVELAVVVDWRAEASCIGRTRLFFATDGFSERLACAVCRRCPVRQPCLADVRAHEQPGERFGVRGGLTAAQRKGFG